jgi:outer membrane PBP1 activator LpoA protein
LRIHGKQTIIIGSQTKLQSVASGCRSFRLWPQENVLMEYPRISFPRILVSRSRLGRALACGVLVLILASLAGCGSTAGVHRGDGGLEARAETAWQQGEYYQAAQWYRQLFHRRHEPADALRAARAMLKAGEYKAARRWLQEAERRLPGGLDDLWRPRWELARAEALAGEGRYAEALRRLAFDPRKLSDAEARAGYYSLKSRLLRQTGQPLPAALTLMNWLAEAEAAEAPAEQPDAIADRLVRALFDVPETDLKAALADGNLDWQQRGWLEAAFVGFGMDRQAASDWLRQWPEHPAGRYFLGAEASTTPRRVAVLLPLSGRYGAIARGIQHGMIAALYATDGDRELNFYDTGDRGEKLADAYFSALENGADFIVGPLSRSAVQQLASLPAPTVPLLALNDTDTPLQQAGFYRFPLSAEDEADDAALRMRAENHKQAVLIAPDSAWGQRVARAFEDSYDFAGGQVLARTFYQEKASDHSAGLRQALGLDASRARARQLRKMLNQKIESAERIDPRIDGIFLAARSRQARMIRPQLKFLHAGHLPIYATSQVYSGVPRPQQDKDLNGIRFADAPIVIRPAQARERTGLDVAALGSQKRYFAFGYDALNLIDRLQWMDTFGTGRMQGLSGDLFLQGTRVRRRPDWAQFRHGVPQPLPDATYLNEPAGESGVTAPAPKAAPVEHR